MPSFSYRSGWADEGVQRFRKTARQFIRNEFAPQQARWQRQRRPDAAAWTAAGRAGLLLPDIPTEYGGGGGSFAHACVVLEELALAGVHFGCSLHGIVAHYLLAYGSEEQKRRWLPRMARGELVGAVALSEANAGSDLQGIRTAARRDADSYVVNGAKAFVTNGAHAGIICLAVKTDSRVPGMKGISLLIVEAPGLAGYRVGRTLEKVGMHAQDTCELFFDDVRVPAANLLGPAEGKGFAQIMEQAPYERLTVGVGAVAMIERALAVTTRHVKGRSAFNKQLIEFQNTRFKLAECKTEAHIGRVFLDDCIERFIAGELDDIATAMAKYWLTERQCRIVDACLQLHGGQGYLAESPIAGMWIDSRVQRICAGTSEIMKEMIGWSL
ncbi:MAG: acyl-CoA dehydrogenase family protein [Rhodocyclaceae bacterium]|nr:acyl-CoA dehydrogenase family protein [Rhodocyclaceae bacterium]